MFLIDMFVIKDLYSMNEALDFLAKHTHVKLPQSMTYDLLPMT